MIGVRSREILGGFSLSGGGDRAGFVVWFEVLSDDLIPKPAPTRWGLGRVSLFYLRCVSSFNP